jgi:uncharacterized OB-fold protein
MTAKCKRCGIAFIVREARQERCVPCGVEVAEIISLDARRQVRRFSIGKSLDHSPSAA